MSEVEEHELEEPTVTDVPEPDQDEEEHDIPGEDSPPGAGPDDPVVEASAPQDDREIEAAAKKLRKLAETNANRIGAIMGEDAQHLEPCPRCMGGDPAMPKTPGFIWPTNIVPLLPEHKAAVKLSIGEGVEPEYKTAQDAARCGQCDGLGKVDSGSQVNGQRHLKCLNCNGLGWTGSRAQAALPNQANGVVEFEPVTVGGGDEPPAADPWGRLKGDPMYGVLPGYEA